MVKKVALAYKSSNIPESCQDMTNHCITQLTNFQTFPY